jgi:hypothetical protein
MPTRFSRRSFVLSSWSLGSLLAVPAIGRAATAEAPLLPSFPTQDPELVREMVGVAHGNMARVKELVGRQRTLAKASWDWGFGDWESALGAASHVGNREIAEFLLANGARPSIFSAAMLGQLDVVRSFIAASPGIQRTHGPHSITLLRHATAGGAQAKPVLDYLLSIDGADDRPAETPLTDDDRTRLAGSYVFGIGANDRIDIAIAKEQLTINRPGHTARGLSHLGSFEFYPMGAVNVRVRFHESAQGIALTIHDPDVVLTARKNG